MILSKPTSFFATLENSLSEIEKQKEALRNLTAHDNWGELTRYEGKDKDYVLVIGESVRRDYMHVYGYPVQNTPFIESIPSIVVDGLTSGGPYTIESLRLMLTLADKKKWQPDFTRNIVDLANKAGIETFWFSNQGYIGKYDTPISAIGVRAKNVVFLNKSSYDTAHYSDTKLLPIVFKNVQKEANGARLFVLHTLGSHPDICARVKEMKDPFRHADETKSEVACYVSSIKLMDEMLKEIYDFMTEREKLTGRPFSILYFSDHGLAHVKEGKILLGNYYISKLHFNIPLFVIDSEQKDMKYLRSKKSGLSFTEGLAHWMGITNPLLREYDLFDGKSDLFDYGLSEKIKAIKHPLDPAIDISDGLVN